MKKHISGLELLALLAGIFIFSSCNLGHKRTIEISYRMKNVTQYKPSYQLAVWLEKPDSSFFKTLFVSDYLAYGGYLVAGICDTWSQKADWDKVSKEEFDAVSGATPKPGKVHLKLESRKDQIPDGEYILCLQVHLKNINELYTGKVVFSGKKCHTHLTPDKRLKPSEKIIISGIEILCK